MEKVFNTTDTYKKGNNVPKWKKAYSFLLFRQDFSGTESLYFNMDEAHTINKSVEAGEVIVHPNYSILYVKDQKAYDKMPDIGCYKLIWE